FTCVSLASTASSRFSDTTWRRFRTLATPSMPRTDDSALVRSASEATLPCRVTRPFTVSTLIEVPLTPSVVRRAILALVVIHASGVAAMAVLVARSTAASAQRTLRRPLGRLFIAVSFPTTCEAAQFAPQCRSTEREAGFEPRKRRKMQLERSLLDYTTERARHPRRKGW